MPDSNATTSAQASRPRPLVPSSGRNPVAPARTRPSRRPARDRPLPDAACIYPVAIPQAAPPYDDAAQAPPSLRALPGLAVVSPPAARAPAARARPLPPRPGQPSPRQPSPGQPSPGRPPAGGTWPSRFAQVLAETLAGARPPEQIAAWTTERARNRIGQLGPLLATAHHPRVRRVLVASPASGVLEMTVIVGLGPRVRALAVRLERDDRPEPGTRRPSGQPADAPRWRCTAVDAA